MVNLNQSMSNRGQGRSIGFGFGLILMLGLFSTFLLMKYVLVQVQFPKQINNMPITAAKNKMQTKNDTLSLKVIKNNVNATFPLKLIKGTHPLMDSSSSKKNSTLVVVWGDVRSSEQAWETLYRQVLDVHQADLALIVQRPPTNTNHHRKRPSLYDRAKYVWEYPDFGNRWDQVVDMIGSSQDNLNWRHFAKIGYIALGGSIVMPKGSGIIIYSLRWFAQNVLEPLLPFYDRFVFTRIDHLYFCADPPLETLPKGSIYVPIGADWSGVADRHVICDREDVMKVLNVLPPIVEHPAKHMDFKNAQAHNTETLLKFAWEREGIFDRVKRYPRNMAITAVSTDTSRWKKAAIPGFGPAHGLLMKYAYEVDEVKQTCPES